MICKIPSQPVEGKSERLIGIGVGTEEVKSRVERFVKGLRYFQEGCQGLEGVMLRRLYRDWTTWEGLEHGQFTRS
jgi:hypothetical protein